MTDPTKITARGVPFPRWVKWAGLVTGFFLLADGLRRVLSFSGGLSAFIPYLLIGSACVYIAGYDKRLILSEKGFSKETLFWGRGRTETLPWVDMEEMVLLPSPKGTTVLFPLKERGWRVFFPGVGEEELRSMAALYREDLPVTSGLGLGNEKKSTENERRSI